MRGVSWSSIVTSRPKQTYIVVGRSQSSKPTWRTDLQGKYHRHFLISQVQIAQVSTELKHITSHINAIEEVQPTTSVGEAVDSDEIALTVLIQERIVFQLQTKEHNERLPTSPDLLRTSQTLDEGSFCEDYSNPCLPDRATRTRRYRMSLAQLEASHLLLELGKQMSE